MSVKWTTIYIDKEVLDLLNSTEVTHHWLKCKTNSDKIFALIKSYNENI